MFFFKHLEFHNGGANNSEIKSGVNCLLVGLCSRDARPPPKRDAHTAQPGWYRVRQCPGGSVLLLPRCAHYSRNYSSLQDNSNYYYYYNHAWSVLGGSPKVIVSGEFIIIVLKTVTDTIRIHHPTTHPGNSRHPCELLSSRCWTQCWQIYIIILYNKYVGC